MRNEYLSREPIEEGLNIPVSVWQEIEDYYDESEEKALEYLLAIGRYCFYGDEPDEETTSRDVLRSMRALIPHIDNQRARYRKAKAGGKGNSIITDDKFVELLKSKEWASQAEVARELGVSRQAISQKLKKLGVTLRGEQLSPTPTNITVPPTQTTAKYLDSIISD